MEKTLQSSHEKGLYFLSVKALNYNHLLCGSDYVAKSVIVYNLGRSGEHLSMGRKKDQDRENETFLCASCLYIYFAN